MGWWIFGKNDEPRGLKNPQPNCVWLSVLCAATWGIYRKDDVRIAVQRIGAGVDHSQAQARINGVWTPLTEQWTGQHLEIVPWQRHYPIEPYRYVSLEDWISEQIKYTGGTR